MRFAIGENGNRITPFPRGRAECSLCNGVLIAHCGDIYSWHWKHSADRECDPWQEHETDWHRNWKAKFPEEWQEVIIDDEWGERHIADVKTNSHVIEFQNSSISTSTIRIREAFYGNMIWVVNAEAFKENFRIRSLVNKELRQLESQIAWEGKYNSSIYDQDIKNLIGKMDQMRRSLESKEDRIKGNHLQIEGLNFQFSEVNLTAKEYFEKWEGKQDRLWQLRSHSLTYKLDEPYKNLIMSLHNERILFLSEIAKKYKKNQTIESLPNIRIGEVEYKSISYNQINKDKLHLIKVISKTAANTLFPEIMSILGENDYLRYKYKQDQFEFAANLSDTLLENKKRISEIDAELAKLQLKKEALIEEISEALRNLITEEIQRIEDEIKVLMEDCNSLNESLNNKNVDLQILNTKQDEEYISNSLLQEKKEREQKFKIMKGNKGVYNFEWKHERKTWRSARTPIYFDIGEDYLFYKIREGAFKKIMITDFLKQYNL